MHAPITAAGNYAEALANLPSFIRGLENHLEGLITAEPVRNAANSNLWPANVEAAVDDYLANYGIPVQVVYVNESDETGVVDARLICGGITMLLEGNPAGMGSDEEWEMALLPGYEFDDNGWIVASEEE